MTHRDTYKISKLPMHHRGMGRIGISYTRRDGARRFDVIRVARGDGRCIRGAVIGHHKDDNVIQLDYDIRVALGAESGEELSLKVDKLGWFGTLHWYVTVRDPHIRISAILAIVSVGLGAIGFALGLISIF